IKSPHLNPLPEEEEDTDRGRFGNQGGRLYGEAPVGTPVNDMSQLLPRSNAPAATDADSSVQQAESPLGAQATMPVFRPAYSTVPLLAKFRGLWTSRPSSTAT